MSSHPISFPGHPINIFCFPDGSTYTVRIEDLANALAARLPDVPREEIMRRAADPAEVKRLDWRTDVFPVAHRVVPPDPDIDAWWWKQGQVVHRTGFEIETKLPRGFVAMGALTEAWLGANPVAGEFLRAVREQIDRRELPIESVEFEYEHWDEGSGSSLALYFAVPSGTFGTAQAIETQIRIEHEIGEWMRELVDRFDPMNAVCVDSRHPGRSKNYPTVTVYENVPAENAQDGP
jgi:hypothetical protein